MKKLFASVVLLFFIIGLHAQIVIDGQDINELEDVQYLEVVCFGKFLQNKLQVRVNYGQQFNGFKKSTILVDNKPKDFNSTVDVLNFFYKNGWEYKDALVLAIAGNNYYHYYLQRKEE